MATRTLTMSHSELDRFGVITRVLERRLKQTEAARILGLGVRHVQRLCAAVAHEGADGLISRKRGRPSSRRFTDSFRRMIETLISAQYADFGPTLACEKLLERHRIAVSNETVRKLMIEAGLWRTRAQRRLKIQQPRLRRPCVGELIQIDGSDQADNEQPDLSAGFFGDFLFALARPDGIANIRRNKRSVLWPSFSSTGSGLGFLFMAES